MKRAIQVILVVGVMVAAASALAWGAAVWFLGPYLIWAPEGIHTSAQTPEAVSVGDTLELTVRIRNDGPGDRTLEAISLELGLLKGFAVEGVEPPFEASDPATDYRVYRFDEVIPAGQVTPVRFDLTAIEAGVFQGRVEIQFVGESRISSTTAATAVRSR